jgi:hypothetical protein
MRWYALRVRGFEVRPLLRIIGVVACAPGCLNHGPCDGAVPPPDSSKPVAVSPTLACAIAVQKDLAGGLTRAPIDGGSTPRFVISQNGYAANSECTAACGYNYNECFLPAGYLQTYVGAESSPSLADSGEEGGAADSIGTGSDTASACPDAASVTVTCTYSSAGFCE